MASLGQPPDLGVCAAPSAIGVWQQGGPSFATITKASGTVTKATTCHRFPTIQLAARAYGTKDGKPSISFSPAELQVGVDNLKHTLVAKFSSGRPHIEDVRKAFMAAWGLGGKCSIGAMDARHILIVLDSEQEVRRVLAHPTRKLGHSFFRIFRWTREFSTKKEPSTTTTWIRLMSLPPELLNQGYISTIVSSFGRFLAVDVKTATFSNPCYARVCIEIDTTISLPDEVWINTGRESGFWQSIVYENRLLFCTKCKLHGHSLETCRKALKRRLEEHEIWEGRGEHGLPTVTLIDVATAMTDKSESAPTAHNLPPPETEDLAWTIVQKRKRKTKQAQKGKTQTITKQNTPACSTSGAVKDKTSSVGQQAKEGQSFIQKGTLAEATSPHGKLLHPSSGTLQTCITDAKEPALNMEACKDPIATLDSTLAGTGIGAGQPLTSDVDYTNSAGSHVLDYTVGIINHHQGTSQGDGALGIISANYGLPTMTIFRRTRDMKISSPAASQKNRSIINSPRSASRRSPSFLLPRVCCLPIRDGLHPPLCNQLFPI